MKIKTKTTSLLLIVLILLPTILTGCTQGGEPKETVSIPSSDIPSLGSPVFMHNITDKNLKDTISAHANGGINVSVKKGDSFSFRVDGISEVKKYSIPRLAPVDKYDPDYELSSYTDMYLPLEYDKETGIFTVSTDWWYSSTGWVSDYSVWSFLIRIEDDGENAHYYYFRMIFSPEE